MENVEAQAQVERDQPAVVVVNNPFVASEGRESYCATFLPGETLGAYCERVGAELPSRVLNVWHNGRPVPIDLWRRLIPRNGDQVVIRARGEGGGGGNKVLRTVAMIAVVVVAIVTQQYYAINGAGFLGMSAATSASVLGAGVMIGGTLMVNALLPMPAPTAAKLGTGQKYENSPTYSIQGGRNRARPWESMALIFGRHKVVPDLAGTPYTMLQGENQYLNQAFHFGLQGITLNIDEIKIGNTPITSYQGVQIQISEADGKLGMFPGNVDTIQGFSLNSVDGWQTRTTGKDVTGITFEFSARLYYINDQGVTEPRTLDLRIQYRKVGATTWTEYGTIGAVYATHYWSGVPRFGSDTQIRYGSTNASDHAPGETFTYEDSETGELQFGQWKWVPHPAAFGQPWVGVAPDPLISAAGPGLRFQGYRQDVTRWGLSFGVPAGQYEIRVMKVTVDINTSREANETAVSQILAFQNDYADYTGQCRLAVRIKASGQLNGAIDELSAVVQAWCTVWNGTAWDYQPTSNPAWWFLWFARGKRKADGTRVYGGGLTDAQIDIEGIKAWAVWCDKKRLTFDYVLDQKMSAAAVLQLIARAGRASMTYQTGKLGVVWDAENLPVSAMFGPFNVRAGSFKIEYVNEGTVDEVVLNFVNKDAGWVMDEVRAKVPGAIATNNPLQLDLDGCVYAETAGREANLIAASQVWKRRRVTWETDLEGLVCTRGDVVSFSHDLTVWGYSGRMMPGSGGTTIKLQNTVSSAGIGTALLRDPDGNMKTVTVTSAVGEDVDELVIVSDLGGFPMPGDEGYEDVPAFDWAWQFDPVATPGRRFKVSGVAPAGDGLRFEAIDDDPEYYACETNPYQYTPPRDGGLLVGVVFSLTAAESIASVSSDQIRVSLSWVLSRDMPVLVTVSVNGVSRISQTVDGRTIDLIVQTGDQIVATVTPKATTGAGTPKTLAYQVEGLSAPLPAVEGLTTVFRDGLTVLSWRKVVDVREPAYEVRLGESWANSRAIGTTAAQELLAVGNGSYWVAARFRLSNGTVVYGPAAGIAISGAVLVRNVLLTQDEAPDWTGAVSGGAAVYEGMLTLQAQGDWFESPDLLAEPDLLWMGGAAPDGTYTNAEADQVDIGYVSPVRLDFDIDYSAISQDDDLFAIADWLAADDLLNGSARQAITVRPQIRHAQVDGEWSDWVDFVPGLINARYLDVRLYLATSSPRIVPFVSRFAWTVDVPDLVQRAESVAIPAAGVRVTFPKSFHARPNLQVTILDSQNGDRAVVTAAAANEEGFDVRIFNGSTAVERNINWIAQGY